MVCYKFINIIMLCALLTKEKIKKRKFFLLLSMPNFIFAKVQLENRKLWRFNLFLAEAAQAKPLIA
jgi:hypothetical protein